MDIAIGSKSDHKIGAVLSACLQLGITANVSAIETVSGQNAQPVGLEETTAGALARAKSAKHTGADIAIGIESGILRLETKPPTTLDIAVIVVLTKDGHTVITTSQGLQFPEHLVNAAAQRGFTTTTVGSVIANTLGGSPSDPHATLTDGRITRITLLTGAIVVALKQL
jgi:inosine/xanthosine triphosphatase